MLLQGSIQRFSLPDVFQFLAQTEATGVLEVRDFEEYGFIYLRRGQVEAISLPISDENLGTRLVRAGCLTEQQLGALLIEDANLSPSARKLKPLGQRLIEHGFANEETIRQVMASQINDQVFELAHWKTGIFLFDEPEQMPTFQVTISANVQELLLETLRRLDEGQEARKIVHDLHSEICYACPIADDCSEEIRARHLKPDVCLWRDLGAVLDESYDRVRDAHQLYRSREDDNVGLEAVIAPEAYREAGGSGGLG